MPNARRIAILTCDPLPEPDPDHEVLLDALAARGLSVDAIAWTAGTALEHYDAAVLRSTWDYPLAPERFAEFVDRAGATTRLLNPASVVRWNLHKGYLLELERRGVAIVPTLLAERGSRIDLAREIDRRGWREIVVKPAISAASLRTTRHGFDAARDGEGQRALDALLDERDALVQPYLDSVSGTFGEHDLVWIDGTFTHAIHKQPRFADGHERTSPVPLDADELAFAERALSAARAAIGRDADLLYARVDLMRDDAGRLVLGELELIEPSLFLLEDAAALARLADGIAARAGRD
jgi:hypothetical protein